MSHGTVRSPSAGRPPVEELLDFASRLLIMSVDNVRTLIQEAPRGLASLPAFPSLGPPSPCMIPETECPPRCVCDVTLDATPDEKVAVTIRVRNDSSSQRTFQLSATPFTGAGGSPGTLSVSPETLQLPPRHAGIATASFTVPSVPEGSYDAEILVHGAYEQCVRVRLRVGCRKRCGDEQCLCEVVQGDPPYRIRAHQWYHHFQCVERCEDPRGPVVRDWPDAHQ